MNVLVFTEMFYPHGGGAELATWLYAKLLGEEGFSLTVVTKQFPGEPSVELINRQMTVYRLPNNFMFGSRYYTLANAGVLASSLLSGLIKKCDVVYIPCGWYSAVPIVKCHGKPVIVHLHNYSIACSTSLMYDFVEGKAKSCSAKSYLLHETLERERGSMAILASLMMNELVGKFYNKLGKTADAIIFVSKAQRNLVLSQIPALQEKSNLIYNPLPQTRLIEAKKAGVGYFGGKDFVKGYRILLKSLKSLRSPRLFDVEAFLAMTSKKHAKTKLPNGLCVNFLPKIKISNLMKHLSVVVVPSLCPEPSPFSLVESMAYGKLVIASNVGGIPEILEGAPDGVKLVEPGNHAEIARALDAFLELPLSKANELGIQNREFILRKFDNKASVSLLNQVFCTTHLAKQKQVSH